MSKRQDAAPGIRRAAIIAAGKAVFSRYGFQRTAMADIAAEAAISRPALYEHFRSKEDLFRSLAESICRSAIDDATAAWPPALGFTGGLTAAVLAKDLELFRLLRGSPHGEELMAQHQRLTADLHREFMAAFAALVSRRAGGGKSGETLGEAVAAAMEGVKHTAPDEASYLRMVKRLCATLGAGVEARTRR